MRYLWDDYLEGISAVVFVVDSADVDRMEEAREEFFFFLMRERHKKRKKGKEEKKAERGKEREGEMVIFIF